MTVTSKSAAIYLRQSMDRSEGIERQRSRCLSLASSRGWTVTEVFEDNEVSATKARGKGTAWDRLLSSADRFDVVIAVDLDRLLRSQKDLIAVLDSGLKVLTVDGELDLTTADGEFRASMLTALARFEVKRKGERQRRANESRATQGKPVAGKRRFGYRSGNMELKAGETELVQYLYAQVALGRTLYALGKEVGWSPRKIRDTLTNPAYAGMVVRRGVVYPSELVQETVSKEEWDLVNAILSDPSRRTSPGNEVKHLMSGIAVCGVCGLNMVYMRSYRCKADTKHPSIQKDILDPFIIEAVRVELARRTLTPSNWQMDVTDSLARSAELSRQRTAAQDLALMPGADVASVRKTLARLGKEIEDVQREIDSARSAGVGLEVWVGSDVTVEDWPSYWNALELERKRELVRALLRVTVRNGRGAGRVEVVPA